MDDVRFPVATMVARNAAELPDSGRHSYEVKWDGWRCVAFRGARVQLQSRQERSLTGHFPEVAEAVAEQLPQGTVLDGELVAMRGGRVDFTALVSPGAQRCLVAFDVLADRGRDVRDQPYRARRDRLAELLGDATGPLTLAPAVDDIAAAQAWMRRYAELGIEGVVAKRLDQPYKPRRYWWEKVRARETTEAVVGGVIGALREPRALLLGRYDERGRLRVIGRTHSLARAVSLEVGAQLSPPHGVHPWPAVIAGGRLGLAGKTDDVAHTPVAPLLVVEVEVDAAAEHGRWRHGARYRRVRTDLLPADVAAIS